MRVIFIDMMTLEAGLFPTVVQTPLPSLSLGTKTSCETHIQEEFC